MGQQTTLLIDGHVHLYPVYNLTEAILQSRKNLMANAQKKKVEVTQAMPVWLLVERSDSNFFEALATTPEKFSKNDVTFVSMKDGLTVKVQQDDKPILFLFAGRQLVTKENLEALSLISIFNLPDRQKPLAEVLQLIEKHQGMAALNWAPGKWFGKRGKIIEEQLGKNELKKLFISETTMRPTVWAKPKLIKKAEQRGFRLMFGSDPLPFCGEEKEIGGLGFVVEGEFDAAQPALSVKNILANESKSFIQIGRRNNFFKFAKRQYKIMAEKKTRKSS